MSNIIPFESQQLPAYLQASDIAEADDLIAGAGGSFPVVSIKGKVFHIRRGDEVTMVQRAGEPGTPAAAIDAVILRANPGLSKNYYEHAFTEGSDEKPTCYSNDGIAPARDAVTPQSTKCATCARNVWGSKITEDGKKSKECQDSRKIAVAPGGNVEDVMLLRVPAASLKPLAEYGKQLKQRGVGYKSVLTRVSFDFTVAYPALTFKPQGFLPEETAVKVATIRETDLVLQILGMQDTPRQAAQQQQVPALTAPVVVAHAPQPTPQPAPLPVPPPPPPQPAAKPAPKKAAAKPDPNAGFGGSGAPAPAAAVVPPPTPVQQTTATVLTAGDDKLAAELAAVLGTAGFDDAQ